MSKTAVIIGAGPAGLTAAWELLARTDIKPLVLEKSVYMGGLARTVNYKGNRIDIGGHRFFSKSDRVLEWWLNFLPLEASALAEHYISYHGAKHLFKQEDTRLSHQECDRVMLLRNRKSRIYHMHKLFNYPINLSFDTISKFGFLRTIKIALSYMKAILFPIRPEKTLEEFFINRFGKELYSTFFRSYAEKIWGVPCEDISAQWGAQRVKKLSVVKVVLQALKKIWPLTKNNNPKTIETSLIEQFLYPKFGPGQMWEEVASQVTSKGGKIYTQMEVTRVLVDGNKITSIEAVDLETGNKSIFAGDYFFSTMPMKELTSALDTNVPSNVKEVSQGLIYRDFIIVGLLVTRLKLTDNSEQGKKLITDNWIYLQMPEVQAGRLQIFNNWSPYLVVDPNNIWLGVEYFCDRFVDPIWNYSDEDMSKLAANELHKLGIIDNSDVIDTTVVKVPNTYPGYFGTYCRFNELQEYFDAFENLYLTGRNGMHKYNNQDHSMLSSMLAVDNILAGRKDKENLWQLNTEMEHHEEKVSLKR